jgi:hypothetical protein
MEEQSTNFIFWSSSKNGLCVLGKYALTGEKNQILPYLG